MRISDWSSDVCSSDLPLDPRAGGVFFRHPAHAKPRVAQERRALQATRYTGAAGQRPREDTARQGGLMSAPVTMPVDIAEIWRMLPHRYPFLLIDRVTEFESGKRVLGYKNVSANEAFFQGHFPDKPVMPGVLVIEALGWILSDEPRAE